MAAAGTVHVKGLKEFNRDLRRIGNDYPKEFRKGLKEAAEPVRRDAAARFAHISARSASSYRVAVRARGVAIQQSLRRTTGQHREFGWLQFNLALFPALESHSDELAEGMAEAFERLAERNGF